MLDGQAGTATDYDACVAAAQEHNANEGHTAPSVSYSHDDPPPDEKPAQWQTVEAVRGKQLNDTDFTQEPMKRDMPNDIQNQIKANDQAWADFRQGLRDIPQTFGYPEMSKPTSAAMWVVGIERDVGDRITVANEEWTGCQVAFHHGDRLIAARAIPRSGLAFPRDRRA